MFSRVYIYTIHDFSYLCLISNRNILNVNIRKTTAWLEDAWQIGDYPAMQCNVAMLQKFRNFRRIKEVKQNSGALEAYI